MSDLSPVERLVSATAATRGRGATLLSVESRLVATTERLIDTDETTRPMSAEMEEMVATIRRAEALHREGKSLEDVPEVVIRPSTQNIVATVQPLKVPHGPPKSLVKPHHFEGAMSAGFLAIEGAELAGVLTGAVVGGVVGSTIVGLGFASLSISHIAHGIKARDLDTIVEGTGSAILAAKSGLTAISLAGHSAHGALHAIAEGAHTVMPVLGAVHGVIDLSLGTRRIIQGSKESNNGKILQGVLGVGMGVSLVAAAVGGGVPAVAFAGVFLAAKMAAHELSDQKLALSYAVPFDDPALAESTMTRPQP